VALIASAAPVVFAAFMPSIKDGLELPLVIGAAQRERVLSPDEKRGPVSAGFRKGTVESVQLRRGHADVERARGVCEHVPAGGLEEMAKAVSQIVIGDGYAEAGRSIRYVIRWIGKHHAGAIARQDPGIACGIGGITAQQAVLAKN